MGSDTKYNEQMRDVCILRRILLISLTLRLYFNCYVP